MNDKIGWDFYLLNRRANFARRDDSLQSFLSCLCSGIHYIRYGEYPLAWKRLNFKEPSTTLDIGSSDSIFPLMLAAEGHTTIATDISEVVLSLPRVADTLGIKEGNLSAEIQDARNLTYQDARFDRVVLLSHLSSTSEAAATCKLPGRSVGS